MGDITLGKAFDDYKTVYMPYRNFAERTRIEYQNDLEDLIEFLVQHNIERVVEIQLPQLERYMAELDRRGMADVTRKRKFVSIRSFLSFLYQDQYMKADLANRLIPPFVQIKSPRYLTKTEYERLLEASSHNPRDFALIQLLLQTGIRLSEVTALTLDDIEPPASIEQWKPGDIGYIHISRGQQQKTRILPLTYKACFALDEYIKRRTESASRALFVNRFGKRLGPRGVEKIVAKYLNHLGIRNANVKSLRHTFGTYYASKGATIKTIQRAMGYRDTRSPMIYVSLNKENNEEEQNNSL